MNKRAQAGLEYLVTYGWALVLVASFVGVMVMLVGQGPIEGEWHSTDLKMQVKGGLVESGIDGGQLVVQNISGGNVKVTSIVLSGGFSDAGNIQIDGQNLPVTVNGGNDMEITNIDVPPDIVDGTVTLNYLGPSGLERTARIGFVRQVVEDLGGVLFFDNMEGEGGDWETDTGDGGWFPTDTDWGYVGEDSDCQNALSGSGSWYLGETDSCTIENGQMYDAYLTSSSIDLTTVNSADLSFSYLVDGECAYWYDLGYSTYYCCYYDVFRTQISVEGGTWQTIFTGCGEDRDWHSETIDLTPYVGNTIKIRFWFDSGDTCCQYGAGVYIDDVQIS